MCEGDFRDFTGSQRLDRTLLPEVAVTYYIVATFMLRLLAHKKRRLLKAASYCHIDVYH